MANATCSTLDLTVDPEVVAVAKTYTSTTTDTYLFELFGHTGKSYATIRFYSGTTEGLMLGTTAGL